MVASVMGVGISILLITLFFPRVGTLLVTPFATAGVQLGQWWSQTVRTPASVRNENATLKEQLVDLAFDRVEMETLRQENEDLKAQLGFVERQSFQHVTGRIILRSGNPVQATFIIDRGSDDGVILGAPITVEDGVLVGKVIDVGRVTSVVLSLTDPRSHIASSILTSSRTLGIVEGTGGSLLTLRFIPQDEAVAINDLVVTSGLEENIPPGLIIGVVNRVTSDRSAPFQEASVEPITEDSGSSIVSVLVPQIPL